jgi:hypothetical protein
MKYLCSRCGHPFTPKYIEFKLFVIHYDHDNDNNAYSLGPGNGDNEHTDTITIGVVIGLSGFLYVSSSILAPPCNPMLSFAYISTAAHSL